MTEVLGIDHVLLTVRDVETSRRYYDVVMKVLGFRGGTFEKDDADGIRLEVTNYRQERRERFENWAPPDS